MAYEKGDRVRIPESSVRLLHYAPSKAYYAAVTGGDSIAILRLKDIPRLKGSRRATVESVAYKGPHRILGTWELAIVRNLPLEDCAILATHGVRCIRDAALARLAGRWKG